MANQLLVETNISCSSAVLIGVWLKKESEATSFSFSVSFNLANIWNYIYIYFEIKLSLFASAPWRYMSKFRPAVVLEKKLVKDAMRTMGPAKVEVASPDKYLRKHSKEPKLSESECISIDEHDQSSGVHLCLIYICMYIHMSSQKRHSPQKGFVTAAPRGNRLFLRGRTSRPWAFTPRETSRRRPRSCRWSRSRPAWTPRRGTSSALKIPDSSPSTSRKRCLFLTKTTPTGNTFTNLAINTMASVYLVKISSPLSAGFWRSTRLPPPAQQREAASSGTVRRLRGGAKGAGSHETPDRHRAARRPAGTRTHQNSLHNIKKPQNPDPGPRPRPPPLSLVPPSRAWRRTGTRCTRSTRASRSSSTPCRRSPTSCGSRRRWSSWRTTSTSSSGSKPSTYPVTKTQRQIVYVFVLILALSLVALDIKKSLINVI